MNSVLNASELVQTEIERQLRLDNNTLLLLLASETIGATEPTSRDGRVILDNVKRNYRRKICEDERVRKAHSLTDNSRVLLVSALLDCIGGAITGVSPITVCVLLVKEGLDTLCADAWGS
jgi:hypothetical protein